MLKSPIGQDHLSNRIPYIKAYGIVSAYQALGYKGVGISSSDLSLGPSFFSSKGVRNFPFISANVLQKDGSLFFIPSTIIETGGIHLGLIGLTDNVFPAPEGLQIVDWQKALQTQLTNLQPKCEMIIVLSSLSFQDNQILAKNYPQVSIIISAYPKGTNRTPDLFNQSLITSIVNQGKYLGQLDIWYRGGSGWNVRDGPGSGELTKRIHTAKRQFEELEKKNAELSARVSKQKIKRLQAHIRSLEMRLAVVVKQQQQTTANSFESHFHAIPPVQSTTSVDNIVDGIRASITAYNKQKLSAIPDSSQNLHQELQLEIYAGSSQCSDCHKKQYRSWQQTQHSKSYATLAERGQEYNPECLACHVTGGTISATSPDSKKTLLLFLPEKRRSVSCETCHGPAAVHCEAPETYLPVRTPKPEICVTCHTPEQDNGFSFEEKLRLLHCTEGNEY